MSWGVSSLRYTGRELRTWQVDNMEYKERKILSKLIAASSYQNLFGCPATRSRPLSKKVNPPAKKDTRTRKQKPLPGMIRAIQKLYNSLRGRGEVTKSVHKIRRGRRVH